MASESSSAIYPTARESRHKAPPHSSSRTPSHDRARLWEQTALGGGCLDPAPIQLRVSPPSATLPSRAKARFQLGFGSRALTREGEDSGGGGSRRLHSQEGQDGPARHITKGARSAIASTSGTCVTAKFRGSPGKVRASLPPL